MSYPLHYRAAQTKWVQSDLLKIITISSLLFVLIHFIRIAALISNKPPVFFDNYLWPNLSLPATWNALVRKPWTLLTYPFVEMSFMRLLGNMIWLWIMGRVIDDLHGPYRVLPIFLVGSLLGGIGFLSWNTFMHAGNTLPLSGSLFAVLGVGVAMLLYKPRYPFWILFGAPVPFWGLFGIFVIINALTMPWLNGATLCLVLGAVLAGLGYNYGPLVHYPFLHRALSRTGFFSNNDNFVLKPKRPKREQVGRIVPFRTLDADMKRIDMILDKINEKGMASLTDNERSILEKYSQKP